MGKGVRIITKSIFLLMALSLYRLSPIAAEESASLQFEMARHRLESRPSDYIFGGHLMTNLERSQYLASLQQAKTPIEKQSIEEQHRHMILERAKKLDPPMWQRYHSE